ncbi:sialate O-acetylesterase [Flavihumibacter sp. UBA7668]|uniref:sialate O-acetylesterase n=1 Tax=Flavihumibacter sp. UBA7668 TaxID=1946542 RepID=UPI0025BCEA5E|nr:sialate O-acetylesterase [Flavihumibacter sp. UBA7668]
MKPHHRPWQVMSTFLTFLLCSIISVTELAAQINTFPLDNQLYPRNLSTNRATVRIAGMASQNSNYRRMRLYVYRDGNWISTYTFNLSYWNGTANYSFDIQIPAERNNYRFSLYGASSWSETHLRTVNNVVAGDAYIIQGQSNAVANLRGSSNTANNADDPSNSPNRNFVRVYGGGNLSMNYTKAWFIGRGNVWYDVDGQTGQWGMRLGSNLVGSTNIPVALFNGAMPGEPLSYFQRNDGSPRSGSTNYGRLLRRIEEAGLQNNIRALIWYQGESDNQGLLSSTQLSIQQYKNGFTNLYNDWKSDYPGLNRFYIVQIRHGCGINSPDNTVLVQEAQRQLDKESTEVLTISSSNTSQLFENNGLNFCHYNFVNGYRNIGDWLSPIIRRDLYGASLPAAIESPEPQSASFTAYNSSGAATQVAITLKDQQTNFNLFGDISNDFRLDGGSYSINSVSLNGATIYINFSRNSGTSNNPSSVTYRSHQGDASPIITNSQGLGLVHFAFFPITGGSNPPPPPPPPPGGTVCPDNYEPNNSISTGKTLPHNTSIQGSIESNTDEDWFNIRIWSFRYFRVRLTNLPADYDMYLYSTTGELIRSVTNSGTGEEAIIYNDGLADASYRLRVVGKNGANDPTRCYSLLLEAFSSPLANPTPPPSVTPSSEDPDPTPEPDPEPEPGGTPCPDIYEPNNQIGASKTLAHNTNQSASIASSTDEDWFSFRTWSFPYFKLSLWNLAADYDIYLYDVNGVELARSTNSGTSAEVINYNDGPANTNYRIKVISKSGDIVPSVCYQIRAEAFSSPLASGSPAYGASNNQREIGTAQEVMDIPAMQITGIHLYPNPASTYITIEYQATTAAKAEFSLVDMAGRIWQVRQENLPAGAVQYRMPLTRLPQGNYVLKIKHAQMIINRKLTVVNQ